MTLGDDQIIMDTDDALKEMEFVDRNEVTMEENPEVAKALISNISIY